MLRQTCNTFKKICSLGFVPRSWRVQTKSVPKLKKSLLETTDDEHQKENSQRIIKYIFEDGEFPRDLILDSQRHNKNVSFTVHNKLIEDELTEIVAKADKQLLQQLQKDGISASCITISVTHMLGLDSDIFQNNDHNLSDDINVEGKPISNEIIEQDANSPATDAPKNVIEELAFPYKNAYLNSATEVGLNSQKVEEPDPETNRVDESEYDDLLQMLPTEMVEKLIKNSLVQKRKIDVEYIDVRPTYKANTSKRKLSKKETVVLRSILNQPNQLEKESVINHVSYSLVHSDLEHLLPQELIQSVKKIRNSKEMTLTGKDLLIDDLNFWELIKACELAWEQNDNANIHSILDLETSRLPKDLIKQIILTILEIQKYNCLERLSKSISEQDSASDSHISLDDLKIGFEEHKPEKSNEVNQTVYSRYKSPWDTTVKGSLNATAKNTEDQLSCPEIINDMELNIYERSLPAIASPDKNKTAEVFVKDGKENNTNGLEEEIICYNSQFFKKPYLVLTTDKKNVSSCEIKATDKFEDEQLAQKVEKLDEPSIVEAEANPLVVKKPKPLCNKDISKKKATVIQPSLSQDGILCHASKDSENGTTKGSGKDRKPGIAPELEIEKILNSPSINDQLIKEMEMLGVPASQKTTDRNTIPIEILKKPKKHNKEREMELDATKVAPEFDTTIVTAVVTEDLKFDPNLLSENLIHVSKMKDKLIYKPVIKTSVLREKVLRTGVNHLLNLDNKRLYTTGPDITNIIKHYVKTKEQEEELNNLYRTAAFLDAVYAATNKCQPKDIAAEHATNPSELKNVDIELNPIGMVKMKHVEHEPHLKYRLNKNNDVVIEKYKKDVENHNVDAIPQRQQSESHLCNFEMSNAGTLEIKDSDVGLDIGPEVDKRDHKAKGLYNLVNVKSSKDDIEKADKVIGLARNEKETLTNVDVKEELRKGLANSYIFPVHENIKNIVLAHIGPLPMFSTESGDVPLSIVLERTQHSSSGNLIARSMVLSKKKSDCKTMSKACGPASTKKSDPCSPKKAKPKKDPCAKPKEDPCAKPKKDPCAKPKKDQCAKPKKDPCANPKKDPCAKPKKDPCAKPKKDPCAKPKKDPCAKPKKDPCAEPKKDPCAKPKKDPCAKPKKCMVTTELKYGSVAVD